MTTVITNDQTRIVSNAVRRKTRSAPQRGLVLVALLLSIVASGCADGPTSPSDTAVVTFGVAGETFRVQLVGERQIEAARAAQGGGSARIPNGRIVLGVGVNSGWSWHLEDVEFVQVAIEVCDGRPSDVERQGMQFGAGRFCPWSARVLAIGD
jgi:hypothetical protein